MLKVDPDLKERIRDAAHERGVTMSGYIRQIVLSELNNKNFDPALELADIVRPGSRKRTDPRDNPLVRALQQISERVFSEAALKKRILEEIDVQAPGMQEEEESAIVVVAFDQVMSNPNWEEGISDIQLATVVRSALERLSALKDERLQKYIDHHTDDED